MRYLQSTYWLEPAGSHGVWGLDDYHFLPFLWGSGQLASESVRARVCPCSLPLNLGFADHRHLRPKAIHDPEILEEFSKDYMYLQCIQFINSVSLNHTACLSEILMIQRLPQIKTASLRWHSPMLDDISAVSQSRSQSLARCSVTEPRQSFR